jgi:carbamoyl-phosphate synthase large subunit
MNVVWEESDLEYRLSAAAAVSPNHPVVITKFIDNAQEIDVDGVAYKGELLVHAVSEHVENAGVHSGDATLVLPPFSLGATDMARLKEIAQKVAKALDISGPFNMQVIKKPAEGDAQSELKVIECNLRASRSFPFVSKVLGHNFIDTATAAITGIDVPKPVDIMETKRDYTSIKVAQFSWTRLGGADPYLGVGKAESHLSLVFAHETPHRDGEYRRSCQLWTRCTRSILGISSEHHWFQTTGKGLRCAHWW